MLNYINLAQKDYYESGLLKRDYNFTVLEADRHTVATITGGVVKILGYGIKAIIASQFPGNKYRLPR